MDMASKGICRTNQTSDRAGRVVNDRAIILALFNLCIIGLCIVLSTQAIAQGLKQSPPLEFTLSESQLLPVTVVKPAIPFKLKQYNSPIELDFQISKKILKETAGANDPILSMELQVAAYFYKDLTLVRKFIDKDKNLAYNNMSAGELEKRLTRAYEWSKIFKMRVTHEFITEEFTSMRVILYGIENNKVVDAMRLTSTLKKVDDFWLATNVSKHPISILINYKFTAPEDLEQRYDGEVIYKKLSNFVTVPPSAFTHHQLHNPD